MFVNNESRGQALRACVYIYIRKHNLLPFIACCIALFEDNPQVCLERVLEDLLCPKWNPTLIRAWFDCGALRPSVTAILEEP